MINNDIDSICELISDLCGIYLDETKDYLIESRLNELLQQEQCESYDKFVQIARDAKNQALRAQIVDAITTNETHFFRDQAPFQALEHKIIPELIDSKESTLYPNRIRIWSAACSTGQEPYSLAIMLSELLPNIYEWDINIFATDISDAVIESASRGIFHELEIQRGLSRTLCEKYFIQADNNRWKAKDELRSLISFQRLNLLDNYTVPGPFDIVLCRNVAIYFKPEVREALFKKITQSMTPAGYLIVGCSESLIDLGTEFSPHPHCGADIYRPNLMDKASI